MGLKILSQSEQWHSDATFKSTPVGFFLLLIIHGFFKNNMCPSVLTLMHRKLLESNKFVLEKLIIKILNLKIQLNPKIIFSDFEISLMKSFSYFWPFPSIKECNFYFSQCIFRQVITIRLKKKYKSTESFRNWVRKLIALSFVPIEEVQDGLNELIKNQPEIVENVEPLRHSRTEN